MEQYPASATLPIANNSLTSDIRGAISGGGGFAVPIINRLF